MVGLDHEQRPDTSTSAKMRSVVNMTGPICVRNIKEAALLMVAPPASSKKNRYRSPRGLFVQNQSVSITIHRSPSTPQAASDRNNRRAF